MPEITVWISCTMAQVTWNLTPYSINVKVPRENKFSYHQGSHSEESFLIYTVVEHNTVPNTP